MVQKIKNIVVAVDFSDYSKPVLDYAVNIAHRTGSKIAIIHIINRKSIDCIKRQFEADHLEYFPYAEYVAREKKRRASKLEAIVETCQTGDIPLSMNIGEGIPSVEILKFLNKGDADFLIIGQKGRSDLPEFLSGGVCEKLFRHSLVPVLKVRI